MGEYRVMSQANKALSLFVVALLGLWGCAQGPANGPVSAERIRALENKIAKLEDDFKAAAMIRDQLKKKLTAVEEERNQLGQQVEQLQVVVKERDELRQQLAVRTTERDTVQGQFQQFRKGIKTLLGQAELATGLTTPPAISVSEGATPGEL
jgi:septal ring factor EnvC (AmiA/AmiB activator)